MNENNCAATFDVAEQMIQELRNQISNECCRRNILSGGEGSLRKEN